MTIVDYNVLITFDLSYANSSDYRAVNSYLSEQGFEKLSHKGNQLPGNTYLGTKSEVVGRFETEIEVAVKLKKQIYAALKKSMNGSGLSSVVFVMVSPSLSTSYSCSKPIDY
ncbi:hypothetical protein [Enterobacter sp.]|uniref:hypothetical protein n=1 Tax=Enterobacter sp. TaxID=42895 RepID=UPI00296E87EF|nr:hypothetical protein [Enterobacter sp.]